MSCEHCKHWEADALDCAGRPMHVARIGWCPVWKQITRRGEGAWCVQPREAARPAQSLPCVWAWLALVLAAAIVVGTLAGRVIYFLSHP